MCALLLAGAIGAMLAPVASARRVPAAQSACVQKLDFAVAEVTTGGCLTQTSGSSPASYTTTDALSLNGISFPAAPSGTHYTITEPGGSSPGGSVSLGTQTITVGGLEVFSGAVQWQLPAGGQGDEKTVTTLQVPAGAKIKGLDVGGSIAFKLGFGSDGSHYALFPLEVDLPSSIKSGPANGAGGVSAAASLRVDASGAHFNGLKLQASNVYIGKLKVISVCFAYQASGSQGAEPCAAPSLNGQPYLNCKESSTGDTWSGSAEIELPTSSAPRLAIFGAVTSGKLANIGGFVDNLGTSLPIVDGVFVNTIGVGLCLEPPPFTLKGTVGVSALPVAGKPTLVVTGSVTYTDSTATDPWSLAFDGDVAVRDTQVGSGSVTIKSTGDVDFDVKAGFTLLKAVSLNGEIAGWIQPSKKLFNLDGSVQACLGDHPCGSAEGLISSTGMAGCLNLGTLKYFVIVKDSNWNKLHFWRVHHEDRYAKLQAGFGYRYGGKVSLFAASCDMGSYQATKAVAHLSAGSFGVSIAPGTPSIALRIAGSNGPPKVDVRGPGRIRVLSPKTGTGASKPGQYALAENPSDGSTNLLLINPAAGEWTVRSASSRSVVTGVTTAPFAAPPEFVGHAAPGPGGTQILRMAYSMPAGDSLMLEEHGRAVNKVIATNVQGGPCPGPVAQQAGAEKTVCKTIEFTPAPGPKESRDVVAYVTDNGVPVTHATVTSFMAGGIPLPAEPSHLQLVRQGSNVIVDWARDKNAQEYTVSVQLSDGRMFGVTPAARCRGVLLRGVSGSVGVKIEIAGLRKDLESGRFDSASLAPGAKRSGPPGLPAGPVCSSI